MLTLVGRKLSHTLVAIDTDRVIAAFPLPQGGRLNQVNLDCRIIGDDLTGGVVNIEEVTMYGIDGYVIPNIDPDSVITYELAWDRFVPKDAAGGAVIDLDTTATDTDPTFEVGKVDISGIFNMTSLAPKQIFRRRRMISFADIGPTIGGQAANTWVPAEAFQTVVKQKVSVNQPSYILFGFSSPALDLTSATPWVPPAGEWEWAILQYMEKFLEDAFISAIGLVETGAETPYVETELYIERLLEDIIFEETADAFHPQPWNVFCASTFNISVPGRLNLSRTLTSEGG